MGISWIWSRWSLSTSQLFWVPLLPKTLFHGTLSSTSWKGWIHSEFQGYELLATFPPALGALNFTILWSLQSKLCCPSHPQWVPPSLVSMRFSRALWASSRVIRGGSCCQSAACPSRIAYVLLCCSSSRYQVHHEDQGLRMWSCSSLPVKGLTCMHFLFRWSLTDTY